MTERPEPSSDRSDMVFVTRNMNASRVTRLLGRLGVPHCSPPDTDKFYGWLEALRLPTDTIGFDAVFRYLGERYGCVVEWHPEERSAFRFSNFVDDGEAALFRLKYL